MDNNSFASSSGIIATAKVKRIPGSCDRCYSKKVRCDRATRGGTCSNCVSNGTECTHARRKGPKNRSKHSIQHLNDGRQLVSRILSTVTTYSPNPDPQESHNTLVDVARYARVLEEQVALLQANIVKNASPSASPSCPPSTPSPNRSVCHGDVISDEAAQKPYIGGPILHEKNDGKTHANQSFRFVQTAIQHLFLNQASIPDFAWRRTDVWVAQPWEALVDHPPSASVQPFTFPPDDLFTSLLDLFFTKVDPMLGHILHEPSFRNSIAEKRHVSDSRFGAVVLTVCALASRHSDDPRVLVDGAGADAGGEHSAGWKWFGQVRASGMQRRAVFEAEHPGTLYQLQLLCLSISFLTATRMGSVEECWILAGLALRFAQAAGVHRQQGDGYRRLFPPPHRSNPTTPSTTGTDYSSTDTEHSSTPHSENPILAAEQYRRVVWTLVVFDTLMSSFHGRPVLLDIEDVDLQLPVDKHQEEWGEEPATELHPTRNGADSTSAKPRRPTTSAFIRAYIQLVKICARMQETAELAVAGEGDAVTPEDVVALDSALNQWVDEIPDHLRLSGNLDNPIFIDQSAALYASYYHAQITLHRGFIHGRQSSNLPFPSLAICTNAARSCGHVLALHSQRGSGLLQLTTLTNILFDAAIVLLVNVSSQRARITNEDELNRATADVQTCMKVTRLYERRWRLAGKRYDGIAAGLKLVKYALLEAPSRFSASATNNPTPAAEVDELEPASEFSSPASSDADRHILALEQSLSATFAGGEMHAHVHALPLRTEELGWASAAASASEQQQFMFPAVTELAQLEQMVLDANLHFTGHVGLDISDDTQFLDWNAPVANNYNPASNGIEDWSYLMSQL
ncbi:Fungal-trans domain-containing protein [Mycena kentingensis (nom. inval.)]|nr:Fungal-trans domain-containing protein [Mycena kentingensis (nom. inval.)]